MFGVVGGRTAAVSGVGIGGLLEAEAIESERTGFSTPMPTGLVVVDPVDVTGGE